MPRGLVHRQAVAEVFLTASERLGEHRFLLAAQWPRRHHYFGVGNGRVDALLVAETLRQATMLVAHQFYEVPRGHTFLMSGMRVELMTKRIPVTSRPPEVTLLVSVDRVSLGTRGAVALRTNVEFRVDGKAIAQGTGDLHVLEPRVYARLRSGPVTSDDLVSLTEQTGETVGDAFDRGLALEEGSAADGEREWALVIDSSHPVFFDHPVDHVPGMLAMEAAYQAACQVAGWPQADLTSFDGRYSRFLDLDERVTIRLGELSMRGPRSAEMTLLIVQRGSAAVQIDVAVEERSGE